MHAYIKIFILKYDLLLYSSALMLVLVHVYLIKKQQLMIIFILLIVLRWVTVGKTTQYTPQ